MAFSDDLNACAALVEKGDPWRFRTVMAAPPDARAKLFPLYAFNVEVSRAPYVTAEPMIAEMRLQWWRDALEEIANGTPRRHEVVTPLSDLLSPGQAQQLDRLVAARRWDCHKDAFEDHAALETYLRDTSGTLMQVAADLLTGPEDVAQETGFALGIASWLTAIPALEAAKRIPLVDGTPAGVTAFANTGLNALQHSQRNIPRPARPAFWPALGAYRVLHAAKSNPARVEQDALPSIAPSFFALKVLFRS
ncbi:MAG: squalene/phytoene synthase family protein [Pseudomonadota bacterium]